MSETPPNPNVSRAKLGIFEVLYEAPQRRFVRDLRENGHYASRLLGDALAVATVPFLLAVSASVWLTMSASLTMVMLYTALDTIDEGPSFDARFITGLVAVWLISGVMNFLAQRCCRQQVPIIDSMFKRYFYPKLARASLGLDLRAATGPITLPTSTEYHMGSSSATNSLTQLGAHLVIWTTILLQLLTQTTLLFLFGSFSVPVALGFGLVLPTMMLCIPSSYFGGAGYLFSTANRPYKLASALHQMIFTPWEYRTSMIKTGSIENLENAYSDALDAAGVLTYDSLALGLGALPLRQLRWQVLEFLLEHSPVLYGLYMSSQILEDPTLFKALLLLQISYLQITPNIQAINSSSNVQSFISLLKDIKVFYDGLELQSCMTMINGQDTLNLEKEQGISLSIKDVSFQYGSSDDITSVLDGVSFDVSPGQLVVIVGTNGSGKTTLLNLLCRLMDPSSGSILVNNKDIRDFDWNSLRKHIAILSQKDVLYPLSYANNFLAGVDSSLPRDEKMRILEQAAEMSESSEVLERFPEEFNAEFTPVSYCEGISGAAVGPIGDAVREVGNREYPARMPTMLSGGETQRLLLGRMFAKLLSPNESCGLMLVDEGLSALDPQALERVSKSLLNFVDAGKTMIAVTHAFGPLVHRADLILCLSDGKIVEQGTHDELVARNEVYAEMYHAQM